MTQVSKYPISKEIADRIFEIFLKSLVKIHTQGEADQFISDLLTPTEKIMLAKRLTIALLLQKDYDYRTIQKIIRVSAPTITSVNMAIRYGSEGYRNLLNKILKEEKLIDMIDESVSKVLSFPTKARKGGTVWRYLKQEVDKHREKNKKAF
ncbi:MAG: YerC/YecD family TrpR-related protein [Candidatus Levybacteria bacterium]|nr:YerC/YecD family TrpR-related protein [Candidatus Levybacteria bacterium]